MNSNQQVVLRPSGRIENGAVMPYNFEIADVFSEAWSKVSGFKATLWGAFGCYILIAIILGGSIYAIGGVLGGTANPTSNAVTTVLRLMAQIIVYPMYAGLLMLGIKRAANVPVRVNMVFHYYSSILRIIGVMLLSTFLIMLPTFLGGLIFGAMMTTEMSAMANIVVGLIASVFVLAGIYLVWAYFFAIQLTTEKRMGVWQSLMTSARGVRQHWWKIFLISILAFLIYIASIIPFFIGLIWSLPFINIVQGVMYRRIFGVEPDLANNG